MENKGFFEIFLRYTLLVILGIPNLFIFYFIFTPLTLYASFYALNSLYGATLLEGNIIFLKSIYIELIPACIAGAAYYLLLILNLSTPMKIKKRLKSLLFLFSSFLILNIIRIIIFASLALHGSQYFDISHNIVWYLGSTLFVIALWFANIFLFKISSLPLYSDLKNIFKEITKPKSRHKTNKTK